MNTNTPKSKVSSSINKKTAIDLINKYAESFKAIEEENIILKSNLKIKEKALAINRKMIETIFNKDKNGNNKLELDNNNKDLAINIKNFIKINNEFCEKIDFLNKEVRIINSIFNILISY